MLPTIEIPVLGTTVVGGYGMMDSRPLLFIINGHSFSFYGTAGEIFTMRRDLEDARRVLNEARARKAAP